MTRASSLWLAAGASALVHVALGWQLYRAPGAPHVPRVPDTFQVRMVALPAPRLAPKPPEPPPPAPPQPAKPRPKPKAAPPQTQPVPDPPAPEPQPADPEPTSAPTALLAESGPATAGAVVQIPGARLAALVTTRSLSAAPSKLAPATAASAAPLAKLSDLSRKPRAPSLDAALRTNYPAALRRRGTEGQAEVRVVIDSRGRVGHIETISESALGFAEACRRTLLGSRWSEPLDRDGNPVSTRLTYRCRFQIER